MTIEAICFFLDLPKDLSKGKIHASRQWDLIISGEDFNDDSCRIPIQVMAEVTGKSR